MRWLQFVRKSEGLSPLLEKIIFESNYEDETKTAAASILLSCQSKLTYSIETYTELVNYEMEVMERPEFTGYLVELFEQNFDNLAQLSKWIEEGITAEKRCSLRLR